MTLTKTLAVLLLTAVALVAAGDIPRPAPPLEAKTLDGRTISLSDLKGKVVGVYFFSSDCPHCQQTSQMVLAPIYSQMKARGLEILGMAVNPSAATNLRAFATQFNAEFPLALSSTAETNRFAGESVMRRFSVPYLFFVDRQGRIRGDHPGQDREFWTNQDVNVRAMFEALLNEK